MTQKLKELFLQILDCIRQLKDSEGNSVSAPFENLQQCKIVDSSDSKVIDLKTIESNIHNDLYQSLSSIQKDLNTMVLQVYHSQNKDSGLRRFAHMLRRNMKVKITELEASLKFESKEKRYSSHKIDDLLQESLQPSCEAKASQHFPTPNNKFNVIFRSIIKAGESIDSQIFDPFWSLPSKNQYPEYYKIIENPISLKMMQRKIETNRYLQVRDLCLDFVLMFNNAIIFNDESSLLFENSTKMLKIVERKMSKLDDNDDDESNGNVSGAQNSCSIETFDRDIATSTPVKRAKYEASFPSAAANISLTANNSTNSSNASLRPTSNSSLKEKLKFYYQTIKSWKSADGSHKLCGVFMKLPTPQELPEYYSLITKPMDLATVWGKIKRKMYRSENQFMNDLQMIYRNAMEYNDVASSIYQDAVEFELMVSSLPSLISASETTLAITNNNSSLNEKSGLEASDLKYQMHLILNYFLEYEDENGNILANNLNLAISKPDIRKIISRWNSFTSVNDLVSELASTLESICNRTNDTKQFYDALILLRATYDQSIKLTGITPNVSHPSESALAHVRTLINRLWTEFMSQMTPSGRNCSDALRGIKMSRPFPLNVKSQLSDTILSVEFISCAVKHECYNRFEVFQIDVFNLLKTARCSYPVNSEPYQDVVQCYRFFVQNRDILSHNGDYFASPSLLINQYHISAELEQDYYSRMNSHGEDFSVELNSEILTASHFSQISLSSVIFHHQELYEIPQSSNSIVFRIESMLNSSLKVNRMYSFSSNSEESVDSIRRIYVFNYFDLKSLTDSKVSVEMALGLTVLFSTEIELFYKRKSDANEVFMTYEYVIIPSSRLNQKSSSIILSAKQYFIEGSQFPAFVLNKNAQDFDLYFCSSIFRSISEENQVKPCLYPFDLNILIDQYEGCLTPTANPSISGTQTDFNTTESFITILESYSNKFVDDIQISTPSLITAFIESTRESLDFMKNHSFISISTEKSATDEEGFSYFSQVVYKNTIYRLNDLVLVKLPERTKASASRYIKIMSLYKNQNEQFMLRGIVMIEPQTLDISYSLKMIYEKELFTSSETASVSLDCIVNKACLMYAKEYFTSRPVEILEDQVFICESKYDPSTNSIRKLKGLKPKPVSQPLLYESEFVFFSTSLIPFKVLFPTLDKAIRSLSSDSRLSSSHSTRQTPQKTVDVDDKVNIKSSSFNGNRHSSTQNSHSLRSSDAKLSLDNSQMHLEKSNSIIKNQSHRSISDSVNLNTSTSNGFESGRDLFRDNIVMFYECGWEDCDEKFKTAYELATHVTENANHVSSGLTCQGGQQIFQCLWRGCQRSKRNLPPFNTSYKLVRHLREVHFRSSGKKWNPNDSSNLSIGVSTNSGVSTRLSTSLGSYVDFKRQSSAMPPLHPSTSPFPSTRSMRSSTSNLISSSLSMNANNIGAVSADSRISPHVLAHLKDPNFYKFGRDSLSSEIQSQRQNTLADICQPGSRSFLMDQIEQQKKVIHSLQNQVIKLKKQLESKEEMELETANVDEFPKLSTIQTIPEGKSNGKIKFYDIYERYIQNMENYSMGLSTLPYTMDGDENPYENPLYSHLSDVDRLTWLAESMLDPKCISGGATVKILMELADRLRRETMSFF